MNPGGSDVTRPCIAPSTPSLESGLRQLLPRLRRFAHALSRSSFDADDLLQSAVERALKARAQWQPGTRLDSWMYAILRNQWIDTVRRRARRARHEAPLEEADRASVGSDNIEATVELHRAMGAMQKLPPEQREVVALVLIEGFGHRETAEILDLPIGTVSSRLARGRTALLAMMGVG